MGERGICSNCWEGRGECRTVIAILGSFDLLLLNSWLGKCRSIYAILGSYIPSWRACWAAKGPTFGPPAFRRRAELSGPKGCGPCLKGRLPAALFSLSIIFFCSFP
ncbi:uncharacterized protein LOC121755035 [Salvia splendens]|uniref:uncharacterized protein LOC121755035 n=1 Tax=Salvia splendens TaxID=180675 RepID=UPI001C26E3EA|nr:uncharacterized protein LOC121755035 [Salvia splendens]